jgi:hypothetical protein
MANNYIKATIRNSTPEFLTFSYQSGGEGVEVRVEDGTVWLGYKSIALLFDTTPENIMGHLKNLFSESEINQN